MRKFRIEMRVGQDMREVDADRFGSADGWLIFYRDPPQGGHSKEYWRVQTADVVSMETKP
jgi:hypothetical protein